MRSDFAGAKRGNLSLEWAEAFLTVMEAGVDEISPLVVEVTDFHHSTPTENPQVRQLLDRQLAMHDAACCRTVASTIFPESLWNPAAENDAALLFDRYERIWPKLHKCHANRRGHYFRRLTAYSPEGCEHRPINQLEHIIATYRSGNHRRSALQAAVFDPTRDHTNCRQQGFPCLQQVVFTPVSDSGLSVTGFYATQYLFERAYGNYLGLCALGRFMAQQMELKLVKMVCIANCAMRGKVKKSDLRQSADKLRRILAADREGK